MRNFLNVTRGNYLIKGNSNNNSILLKTSNEIRYVSIKCKMLLLLLHPFTK